jgi:hypothetical protein
LSGITTGRDGNLWFTDFLGHAIVRMTPGGVVKRFPFAALEKVAAGARGMIRIDLQAAGAGTFRARATFGAGGPRLYGEGSVSASGPGPVTVTVHPTAGGRAGLNRHGHLGVSVHLTFRSASPPETPDRGRVTHYGTVRVGAVQKGR